MPTPAHVPPLSPFRANIPHLRGPVALQLKVAHKSGTNDVAVKVETKTPIEFSVEHDVRPKVRVAC